MLVTPFNSTRQAMTQTQVQTARETLFTGDWRQFCKDHGIDFKTGWGNVTLSDGSTSKPAKNIVFEKRQCRVYCERADIGKMNLQLEIRDGANGLTGNLSPYAAITDIEFEEAAVEAPAKPK